MLREIANLEELKSYASEIIAGFEGQRLLVLLDGPMGAGKTQLTRFLLDCMNGVAGIQSPVTSPSFAIHNHYDTEKGAVEHVDLYRIDNKDDLESTGFWDLFQENGVVIIEWSDRLKDWGVFEFLPRNWPTVKLRFEIPAGKPESARQILEQKTAGRKTR